MNENKITINGVDYVRADSVPVMAEKVDGMEYCIIRTYSAGVHVGYVKERDGKCVELISSRRLWKWAGAFTLSELSKNGTTDPNNCKFATTIDKIILTEVIEIIPCTELARNSIESVTDYEV